MPEAKYFRDYSLGLSEDMYQFLKKVSQKNNVSMAHILRYIVRNAMEMNKSQKPVQKNQCKPKFKKGDFVQVKQHVTDDDLPTVSLGGWQGTVTEISQDSDGDYIYEVQWTDLTLEKMPKTFSQYCILKDYVISQMDMMEDDLELMEIFPHPKKDALCAH